MTKRLSLEHFPLQLGTASARAGRAEKGIRRSLGNTAPRAIEESFGIMMVNYLYDHKSIEDNHEAFVRVFPAASIRREGHRKCIS